MMADIKRKVPNLRFKGFTDDWEQRKLGDEYKHIGNDFVGTASPYYTQNGYFYLESNNIKNGQINHDHEVFINESFYHKQLNKLLHTGDLVMVQSGHVGDTAVITEKYNGTAAHALIMFRKPQNNMLSFFLNSFFQSSNAKNRIDVLAIGNTIRHILASDMKKFVVYLPDNKEKVEVAELFLELQKLISLQQRKLEQLKQLKTAMLQQLFVNKNYKQPILRFKNFNGNWEKRKFSELATIRRGLTYKPKDVRECGKNSKRVLRSSNINENSFVIYNDDVFVDKSSINIAYVHNNDILITAANGSSKLVGKHALIHDIPDNSAVHGGFMLLASSNNPEFINALMSSPWYSRFVNNYVIGGNGAIGNLKKDDLDSQIIYTPIKNEIKKIGHFFNRLDNLIALQQNKLTQLTTLKKYLLQKLFI